MPTEEMVRISCLIEKSQKDWLAEKGKGLRSNPSHALRVILWDTMERERPTGRAVPKPDKGDT